MKHPRPIHSEDCTSACGCSSQLDRRDFIQLTGTVAASAGLMQSVNVMAGPFTQDDQAEHLVPADKRLSDEWLSALTQRGTPEVYQGEQLRYVGMPVGGICCGQLYLGGDGRLWLWDIFQSQYQSDYGGMSMGAHYAKPPQPGQTQRYREFKVSQGFVIRIQTDGADDQIRTLDQEGFTEITFRGEYPIGRVTYRDPACPVEIELEAFSPFIPLNAEDSALPATVMSFTVRNLSKQQTHVEIMGYLQNAVCPDFDSAQLGRRVNRVQRKTGSCSVLMTAEPPTEKAAQTSENDTLDELPGFGSMAISLLGDDPQIALSLPANDLIGKRIFDETFSAEDEESAEATSTDFSARPISGIGKQFRLDAEESRAVDFIFSWHFPHYRNVTGEFAAIQNIDKLQRHYAARFENAASVADYLAEHFDPLTGKTRLWNSTWYDSTLPYWLLDRTFVSLDCLATQTCHWFDSGRFYGWEGVSCCPGTCQHVWNYAQGLARVFPELERTTREHIDYGIAFQESGELWYRAESGQHIAHDGQCGTIIRAYREHTTSTDDSYLRRIWPKIRKSIELLIALDQNQDGLLEGKQYNTLDQAWYGPMGWISSMYLAAVEAGHAMAVEMEDPAFAGRCQSILAAGRKNLVSELFNGEYFVHKPPNFESTNTNDGCHIDQVFGQALVWQVGLRRVVSRQETVSSLAALWKYNFAPDAGRYHQVMREGKKIIKAGRWFAMPGEAGLVMCTWPTGGAEHASGVGENIFTVGVGYFNECMNGFEYQVASHMIYEGEPDSELVTRGLAITRAVHDRYAPEKRNPYNEVECSDHYSRSMASYGVFLAACGFEYHGPTGHIGFSPRLSPEQFKAPFTAAEAWGSYEQRIEENSLLAKLEVLHGSLELQTFGIVLKNVLKKEQLKSVLVEGRAEDYSFTESRLLVDLGGKRLLKTGDSLSLQAVWKPEGQKEVE